jgi:integrase
MPRKGQSRGIPGEGYLTGGVYRVPLPKAPGERRARYAERKVPAHILSGRRSELAAWQRDFRAEALAKVAQASTVPAEPETVGAFLTRWLAELPAHLAPNTRAVHRRMAARHIIPALGDVPLAALGVRQVERWLAALPLKPTSAAVVRATLVVALNDAVRWELVSRNVASLARAPRRTHTERPAIDADGARRLLAAAAGDRLGAMVVVALALGLRRGELIGLRWRDVDLDVGRLTVAVQRQHEPGRGQVERPPKAGSAGVLTMPGLVSAALTAHRDRQRFEAQQLGWQDSGLVFTGVMGQPLTNDAYSLVMRRAIDAAGLPAGIRPHDCRHATMSLLLGSGVDLATAMRVTRHRSSKVALEVYGHATAASQHVAAERMDAALGGVG